MDVVDKLTAIDLKAATSAGEIANGLAQFANIGSLSGVNIDEAAAPTVDLSAYADWKMLAGLSANNEPISMDGSNLNLPAFGIAVLIPNK